MATFSQNYNVAFSNKTNNNINCQFRFRRPDEMFNNLNMKKIRCQRFTLSNTYIPLMIPDRVVDSSYFNVSPNATVNTNINNTLTVDSLKYFFIIRTFNNSEAVTTYVRHISESPDLLPPPAVIQDDVSYYLNEYYYYHSLQHFFTILEEAVKYAAFTLTGSPDPKFSVTINPTSNTFSFYFDKVFADNYVVEFSESLIRLFPLKNAKSPATTGQSSYKLIFDSFESTSGEDSYRQIDCLIYDTIFPFSELLINSDDLGINFTQFITDDDFTTNNRQTQYNSNILSFNMRTTTFNEIYDYYYYINNDDSLWNNFYLTNSADKHISIQLFLRLKNNVIIPMQLKPKDLFTMNLELKYTE